MGNMKLQFCLMLLMVSSLQAYARNDNCPLWTSLINDTCKCDHTLKEIVLCNDGIGAHSLLKCYCMTTTDKNKSLAVVGPCLQTCSPTSRTYKDLHLDKDITDETCGPFHRTGVLCSKCIEGYGLPVYSYNLSCVNCTDYKYNWIKYIAVAYGPLTLFYIVAVILRISATSGLMICYVTICQMLTIRGQLLWVTNAKYGYYTSFLPSKILITLFSVWNLDFFRSHYTPFCLHPTISALHVLLLDYLVAVYPLILILITYSLVKLHDRYTLVVWFCKPLYICFHKFRKEWDIKTSLVASFATFYLLSYVKIINVTADILTPTFVHDAEGDKSKLYYYYNASILLFGKEHLPYAVFAIIFSFLFNVCPLLLLCLYPCTCFHKCLNKTGCRCHTLHVFMDALLGSFSHKPRERRYFGALYLILKIVNVTTFLLYSPVTYITLACYIILIFTALIAALQPYKNPIHSRIDLVLFLMMANIYLATLTVNSVYRNQPAVYLYGASAPLPLYGLGVLLKKTLPQRFIKHKLKLVYRKIQDIAQRRELEESSLPYRLEHSESDPLLNTAY